jgi:enoyl-CoA hydratase
MPDTLVHYRQSGRVAVITMDDGKRNALSPAMFSQIYAALERAEREQLAVLLTGREQVFSAGFDLKVMRRGGTDALRMLRAGYSLTARLLSFPRPVVAACPGHAFAMGAFMLLSCDYRIGVPGEYVYSANEVAIGLTVPRVATEVLRLRLTPAAYQRAAVLAEKFAPEPALQAGFVDELVPAAELLERSEAVAQQLMSLDMKAHLATKLRVRAQTLQAIRSGVRSDLRDALVRGAKQLWSARTGAEASAVSAPGERRT